jgi:hypothetical protein
MNSPFSVGQIRPSFKHEGDISSKHVSLSLGFIQGSNHVTFVKEKMVIFKQLG